MKKLSEKKKLLTEQFFSKIYELNLTTTVSKLNWFHSNEAIMFVFGIL